MENDILWSLKEVAEQAGALPHRIIHLCEIGLIRPAVNAVGRGKFRQFNRDNLFRIWIALEMQDAGLQGPYIKPLMDAFDLLLSVPKIQEYKKTLGSFNLVDVVKRLGSSEIHEGNPALAWVRLKDKKVVFVTPLFQPGVFLPKMPLVSFVERVESLTWSGVGLLVNLSSAAAAI